MRHIRLAELVSVLTCTLFAWASTSLAAQGDLVGQIPVPSDCASGPHGLAFDGNKLYYTLSGDPASGTIYMVDAATGQFRGSFVANRGGTPINKYLGGLDFDRNRGWLWAGEIDLFALEVPTGEVIRQFPLTDPRGVWALAYDPGLDKLWEGDGSASSITCWRPNGDLCGAMGSSYSDHGLGHDGADLWRFVPDTVLLPGPPVAGVIVPAEAEQQTDDLLRAFDIPGVNYRDLAFDCSTFAVPVVWVTDWWNCRLVAYEVNSRARTCVTSPGPRILRGQVDSIDLAKIRTKLPLVTAIAEHLWRPPLPLDYTDDQDRILVDDNWPFVVYRLLGPGDSDQGNRLNLVKVTKWMEEGIRIVE